MTDVVILGWAMSGCRWRRRRRAGLPCRVRHQPASSRPERRPVARRRPLRRRHRRMLAARLPRHHRRAVIATAGHDGDLRARPRSPTDGGPDLARGESAPSTRRRAPAPGHAGGPGVDHLPGHHRRGRTPDPRGVRARRRHATSTSLLARSGSTRATRVYGLRNTPKVVGGITPACTDRAAEFYGRFVDTVVPAKGTREAETAKLLENTYRHVNIALVNEMARFCHELNIDFWDVIAAPAPSRSASRRSIPAPASAGTASRSTRTTCPTTCEPSWATRSGSSSWPRRSTRSMPATSSAARRTSSTRTPAARGAGAPARGHLQARHRRPARVAGRPAGAALLAKAPTSVPRPVRGALAPRRRRAPVDDLDGRHRRGRPRRSCVQNHRALRRRRARREGRERFFDTRGVTTGDASHRL